MNFNTELDWTVTFQRTNTELDWTVTFQRTLGGDSKRGLPLTWSSNPFGEVWAGVALGLDALDGLDFQDFQDWTSRLDWTGLRDWISVKSIENQWFFNGFEVLWVPSDNQDLLLFWFKM